MDGGQWTVDWRKRNRYRLPSRETRVSDLYYGLYLIPPPALVYPLSLAHDVFENEFGAITAGRFMVHCTIKGFTKLAPGASPESLIPAFDRLFEEAAPFEVEIKPPWVSSGVKPGESILLWLEKTPEFQKFHNDVWEIIKPHVADDCLFTSNEWLGERFPPHLTLVQTDLPAEPVILAQAMALADYVYTNLPAHTFLAHDLQLVEFESGDWAGSWWKSLRYRQIKGWKLDGGHDVPKTG